MDMSLSKLQEIVKAREAWYCQWFIVHSLSCVQLFAIPWTAALQASLSFTVSQSLLKFMSTESVIPSNISSFVSKSWTRLSDWTTTQRKSPKPQVFLKLTDADCPQTGLVSIQTYISLGLKGSPDHFKCGWSQNAMVSESNLGLLLSSSYCSILKMSTVQYIVGTLNSHPEKWCCILSVTQTRSQAIITDCPSAFPTHSGPHPVAPSLERMDTH